MTAVPAPSRRDHPGLAAEIEWTEIAAEAPEMAATPKSPKTENGAIGNDQVVKLEPFKLTEDRSVGYSAQNASSLSVLPTG